jgi:hypothetical protein
MPAAAVPLNEGTDDGLFRLLLVPSGAPTSVPVKPGTVEGLFRLAFVPRPAPAAVPLKPETADEGLRLGLPPAVDAEPVEPPAPLELALFETAVFEPAPVEVVVTVVLDATVVLGVSAVTAPAAPDAALEPGFGLADTWEGGTSDGTMIDGPMIAALMIAEVSPLIAPDTARLSVGAVCASARIPASASVVPTANVTDLRILVMRFIPLEQAIDVPGSSAGESSGAA